VLLALDIGNTNLKCGVFRERSLLARVRVPTRADVSAEALAAQLRDGLAAHGIAATEITAGILASVVPALVPIAVDAMQRAFACPTQVVGPDTPTGITLAGPSPLELGADRLVNAVAAQALLGASGALVVDLGTATKLDCISPRGEFLGGVIAPGVAVSLEALVLRAARLRSVELRAPRHVLGRSSVECVQSGLIYGHASLVDGLVARLRRELPFACEVLATGGLAALIAPHTESLRRIEPDLTLLGLRAIHAANGPPPVEGLEGKRAM
jgi:type III pantothenate kinase